MPRCEQTVPTTLTYCTQCRPRVPRQMRSTLNRVLGLPHLFVNRKVALNPAINAGGKGSCPSFQCPSLTSLLTPLTMLVPARGSAPLRGCLRKGLTDSSLRASSGYARKGKSGPFRPSLPEQKYSQCYLQSYDASVPSCGVETFTGCQHSHECSEPTVSQRP